MFVKIWLFFLLLNLSVGIFDSYATELGQTAVAGNLTTVANPNIFNNTDNSNTILANLTDTTNSTIVGHTGDDTLFDPITDATDRLFFAGEFIIDIVTAGFVIDVMTSFEDSLGVDFPEGFDIALQMIVGFANVWFVIYMITGRTIPSFT